MDCQNIVSTSAYDLYKLSNDPSPPSPPPAPCDVCLTEAACRTAVNALGLDEGGAGSAFASSTYSTKGCYAYSSGSYAGMAFWSAGTYAQMTETFSGEKYRVSCPEQCQELPAAQPSPPQPSSPTQAYSFELVHDGGECGSNDAGLPRSDSVEECAANCAAANGCEFFSYNAGNRYCFHEYTASRDCPEGFEVDDYAFYALVPAGFSPSPSQPLDPKPPPPPPAPMQPVLTPSSASSSASSSPASLSHVLVQEQKECDDDGETSKGYLATLQECADECAATTGCVNFIYGRVGAGRCGSSGCKCYTVRATAPLPPPPASRAYLSSREACVSLMAHSSRRCHGDIASTNCA